MFETLVDLGRSLTVLRRRHSGLRHWVPYGVANRVIAARSALTQLRPLYIPVRHRAEASNVLHCSVHKAGSQWITSLLSDPVTFQYSGLSHFHYLARVFGGYDPRRIHERSFERPFPAGTIVSPVYTDYGHFSGIQAEGPLRAFFVMRDPRDLIVSWYFSVRFSHVAMGDIARVREELEGLSKADGLAYSMERLHEGGTFPTLRSWAEHAPDDPRVMLVRYEDLAGEDSFAVFRRLFDHLDIRVPDEKLAALLDAYSFKRLSGRKRGQEDKRSHIRKGAAGDWRNHLDTDLMARFESIAGDLVGCLGYSEGTK